MTEINLKAAMPSSRNLIITLGVISMISGLLVVFIYEYTKPIIADNQREAIEKAIFKVLPQASRRSTFSINADKLVPADDKSSGELIYAGYGKNNQLVGLALVAAAQGYQDTVKLLYSYDVKSGCITGFQVLKSTETPGFGTKITTDNDFLANFKCLSAKVNADQTGLEQAIKTVRHGTKQHPWEVDAISGATITSNAIGKMLNQTAQAQHPIVMKNITVLQQAK